MSKRSPAANMLLFIVMASLAAAHSHGSDDTMSDDTAMNMTLMGMDSMGMVFFTSSTTPLFSWAWTPNSLGQYAGTCIFLIAFAAIFRALLAFRAHYYDVVALLKAKKHGDKLLYRSHFNGEAAHGHHSWRAADAVRLASLDVVIAGVGYLLMIAVMTMNVGYFMSILAGVFVGGLAFAHLGGHNLAGC